MTSRRSSGSMRADSAVEPTRSENITVTWRRSAVSFRAGSGTIGADAWRSVEAAIGEALSSRIARNIFRRCPSDTPSRSKSWSVSSLRTSISMSLSAKRSAYSDMPSFLSQSAICCIGGPRVMRSSGACTYKSPTNFRFRGPTDTKPSVAPTRRSNSGGPLALPGP